MNGVGGKDVVDLLANCFQAVYSNVVTTHVRDNNSIDPKLEDIAQRTLRKGIEISKEEIHTKLRELSRHIKVVVPMDCLEHC
jgi:hypothetical protein